MWGYLEVCWCTPVKNGVANRQPSITGEIALQAVSDLFGTLLYLHKLQVNSLAFGVGMARPAITRSRESSVGRFCVRYALAFFACFFLEFFL